MRISRQISLGHTVSDRDYVRDLLEGSRWLSRDQFSARQQWFDGLLIEEKQKAENLFRFEMMLKALVCFGAPVNHPGRVERGTPLRERDFSTEQEFVSDMLRGAIDAGNSLLSQGQRPAFYQRYLESAVSQDRMRLHVAREMVGKDTPHHKLAQLVAGLENLQALVEAQSLTVRTSYQNFRAIITLVEREIQASIYFNPLPALEWSSQYDQLRSERIVELVTQIQSGSARRATSLFFLSSERLLRYLDEIQGCLEREDDFGVLYGWLALFISDSRALNVVLRRNVSLWVSAGFVRLYDRLEAGKLETRYGVLEEEYERLHSLCKIFTTIGAQLRLELLRECKDSLPTPKQAKKRGVVEGSVRQMVEALKVFLQNSNVLVAKETDVTVEGNQLFDDFSSEDVQLNRLRREIWMFEHILRAFIDKTKVAMNAADTWSAGQSFAFVDTFVNYFRAMGYPILRYSDQENFSRFTALVRRLREGDALQKQQLTGVIDECQDLQNQLKKMFKEIGSAPELAQMPFDRKEAARTLASMLGR